MKKLFIILMVLFGSIALATDVVIGNLGELIIWEDFGNSNMVAIVDFIGLDYFEYANDAAAQVAYVNSDTNYDAYTKLLVHFDGTDGSTANYTAETGQTVSLEETAQLDTAQKKFGTASLLGDGNSDYASVPDSANWDFGSGNFTIEAWMKLVTTGVVCGQWAASHKAWAFVIGANTVIFYYSLDQLFTSSFVFPYIPETNTWFHIAAIRNGNDLNVYINGSMLAVTGDVTGVTFQNSTYALEIGVFNSHLSGYFNGWIDEVRISKGVARWTSDFTSPTAAYPLNLQCHSESTLKTQGSYSMKAIANTDSLADTLTRTVSPTIDLSGQDIIKFDVRSESRTGSNVKVSIHDSGGTTTENTPNIASTGAWQNVEWDISDVADENKDVINQIILTIEDADLANEFYIDNCFAY